MDRPTKQGDETYPIAGQPVVDVEEAKTHFAALVERAQAGEEIVIAQAGQPVVKLVPIDEPPRRRFGGMTFDVPDDFDAPMGDEQLAAWE